MAALTNGTILEQTYEIIEEIGSGGGGIVYKARHLRLNADVVVKKIKDEVIGKVSSRREADILKKLKHPYLPRVYDFIERGDGIYTVMDFIQGENLDTVLKKQRKFSQKQVMIWARQLGEALAYLHGQNPQIIHSDIKPANIMLTPEGNVCLIDFNISLALGDSMESAVGISAGFSPPEQYMSAALYAKITNSETLQKALSKMDDEKLGRTLTINEGGQTEILMPGKGKTEVLMENTVEDKTELLQNDKMEMSMRDKTGSLPEFTQYIGKGVDARSDIYSLGVTLYVLLTGITPAIDCEKRIPLVKTNVTFSEGFVLILEKMMDISPDRRYQNGGEYLKAICNCRKLDHRYIIMHRWEFGMQMISLLCLGFGILTVLGGLFQLRREADSAYYGLIQEAQEAMKQYSYEEAETLLGRARGISQTRIEAYKEEIYGLYLSGNYEECISQGLNYINAMPFVVETEEDEEQFGDLYYIVGNAYFETGDYANAENLLTSALEYNTKNGLYYRDYAITLARLGQIEEAEEQLERGIAIGISQDSIYMAQGEIAHVGGRYQEASDFLCQTVAITSDLQMKKRAVLLCADVYRTAGNDFVEDEIALLEQYMGQFGANTDYVMTEYLAEAYTRKAQIDKRQEETCWQKALMLLEALYEQGYVTYQLRENMVILYENMDCFEEAENLLMEMVENYPKRYEVYKRLAYLEADRQQTKENEERDYGKMQIYYGQAVELYDEKKQQDLEMQALEAMMQELKDGGWL